MTENSKKIESMISEHRVKLHLFEPSQRKVWTVVGKGKEHWMDPESEFCSCPGYYFGQLNGKSTCYHIESQKIAQKEDEFETIRFSDEEFSNFVFGLLSDI